MNYDTNSEQTTTTVSTVTKHIKIYSDNPIHDCIDRIIDCMEMIDRDEDWAFSASIELCEVVEQLFDLSLSYRKQKTDEFRRSLDAKRPN